MKVSVGILGATGIVGQQYLAALADHPFFEVTYLAGSANSAGKKFGEVVKWRIEKRCDEEIFQKTIHSLDDFNAAKNCCSLLFSALPSEVAKIYEEIYAAQDFVIVSNASYHRFTKDVPLLIPEVNPHHLDLIPIQRQNRGWKKGCIVVKPNCSIQSFMIPLSPLHQSFGLEKLSITTLQSISGAGYPGLSSFDMIDNVIPYIESEEIKTEKEPLKIWGKLQVGNIQEEHIEISSHCNRVPTLFGHIACVSAKFCKKPTLDAVKSLWQNYHPEVANLHLPSLPKKSLIYLEEMDRPQPRLDKDNYGGMAITLGRLRGCNLFDLRFVGLSNNTIRGAAGGGILNAELLYARGFLNG